MYISSGPSHCPRTPGAKRIQKAILMIESIGKYDDPKISISKISGIVIYCLWQVRETRLYFPLYDHPSLFYA